MLISLRVFTGIGYTTFMSYILQILLKNHGYTACTQKNKQKKKNRLLMVENKKKIVYSW